MRMSVNNATLMALDEMPPATHTDEFVCRIKPPGQLSTMEDVEKEIMSFNPDYWTAVKHRQRGKSIHWIHRHFNGKYSMSEISYMIEKVVIVNAMLSTREVDSLRQSALDELRELKSAVWAGAEIDPNTNETVLSVAQVNTIAKLLDREILLQGLNKPEKVEVDITHNVDRSVEELKQRLDRFMEANQRKVIDVTPKDE